MLPINLHRLMGAVKSNKQTTGWPNKYIKILQHSQVGLGMTFTFLAAASVCQSHHGGVTKWVHTQLQIHTDSNTNKHKERSHPIWLLPVYFRHPIRNIFSWYPSIDKTSSKTITFVFQSAHYFNRSFRKYTKSKDSYVYETLGIALW